MEGHIIINIGRQFGSGGKGVAAMLGRKLDIPVYDNELISKAAEESGLSKEMFARSDEKRSMFNIASLIGGNKYYSGAKGYIGDNEIFLMQSETIRNIATQGSAIFVGRASDYVLRDMKCLDVFLCAPLENRVRLVSEREGLSAEEAERFILKQEKARANYYNYLTFSENWGVADNYDLCLDTSILGIEGTADFIIDFAKKSGYIK